MPSTRGGAQSNPLASPGGAGALGAPTTLTACCTAGWLAGCCLLVPATHASVRCSAVGWLLVETVPQLSFSAVQYFYEGSVPLPLPRRGIVPKQQYGATW
eukprot:SAG25_NODE_139_length_14140_cov_7.185101_12_plen_100_part_00